MKFVGDVYYVTLDYDELWYHTQYSSDTLARGAVCRDALEKLDPIVEYSQYDHWKYSGEILGMTSGSDDEIDQVWFILRNYHDYDSTTSFGTMEANMYILGESVTLDGVIFRQAITTDPLGRGITLFGPALRQIITMKDHSGPTFYGMEAHELSHHLWTSGHFGDGESNAIPGKAGIVRGDFFTGYAINAGNAFGCALGYEKWRLGWIDEADIKYISSADKEAVFDLHETNDSLPEIQARVDLSQRDTTYRARVTGVQPFRFRFRAVPRSPRRHAARRTRVQHHRSKQEILLDQMRHASRRWKL